MRVYTKLAIFVKQVHLYYALYHCHKEMMNSIFLNRIFSATFLMRSLLNHPGHAGLNVIHETCSTRLASLFAPLMTSILSWHHKPRFRSQSDSYCHQPVNNVWQDLGINDLFFTWAHQIKHLNQEEGKPMITLYRVPNSHEQQPQHTLSSVTLITCSSGLLPSWNVHFDRKGQIKI